MIKRFVIFYVNVVYCFEINVEILCIKQKLKRLLKYFVVSKYVHIIFSFCACKN